MCDNTISWTIYYYFCYYYYYYCIIIIIIIIIINVLEAKGLEQRPCEKVSNNLILCFLQCTARNEFNWVARRGKFSKLSLLYNT